MQHNLTGHVIMQFTHTTLISYKKPFDASQIWIQFRKMRQRLNDKIRNSEIWYVIYCTREFGLTNKTLQQNIYTTRAFSNIWDIK